jgi:hypothetical protein
MAVEIEYTAASGQFPHLNPVPFTVVGSYSNGIKTRGEDGL